MARRFTNLEAPFDRIIIAIADHAKSSSAVISQCSDVENHVGTLGLEVPSKSVKLLSGQSSMVWSSSGLRLSADLEKEEFGSILDVFAPTQHQRM